ncbi:MAG: ArsR/SmtB family transcription factor [Solirubrobacteraceae bacterium]
MRHDARHPDTDELDLLAVLHALSDPVRMQVVQTLAQGGEHSWGALEVPVAKSTLSHHLKVLRSAGVTRTRNEGQRCFVDLRADDLEARFPGVLRSLLASADRSPPPAASRSTVRGGV